MLLNIFLEDLLQLSRCLGTEDKGVHLVVELQGAGIQIGSPHCTEQAVYHHKLTMVKAPLVVEYLGATLHQLLHLYSGNVIVRLTIALF